VSHSLVTPGASFSARARRAVADGELQLALRNLDVRLRTAGEFGARHPDLKDRAAGIRRETLSDLDGWLDTLQDSLEAHGAIVHRCASAGDARDLIVGIAREESARLAVKSKSMATEEIELADALEAADVTTLETDLGEYIVQLAGERPSHIITPVIHKTLRQIAAVLADEAGAPLPVEREALTAWVRDHLRACFLEADLAITGANFAAADTGTLVLVTNEGNGRLCTSLPRVQISVVPVEKVIPRLTDLAVLLPALTMSATGQRLSNYLSLMTGPRRAGEVDGPERLHVVLLDNGRRRLLGTPYEEMLACVRCGACLNVCPVYRQVGGHAYDSVYPGPMGKVLTPLLSEGRRGRDLPGASTLCGACTEACPVEIPLADLLVRLRADLRGRGAPQDAASPVPSMLAAHHDRRPGEGFPWPASTAPLRLGTPAGGRARRLAFAAWARLWSSARGYRATLALARTAARVPARGGWMRRAPGLHGWTRSRDLPVPAARPFRARWTARATGREQW